MRGMEQRGGEQHWGERRRHLVNFLEVEVLDRVDNVSKHVFIVHALSKLLTAGRPAEDDCQRRVRCACIPDITLRNSKP